MSKISMVLLFIGLFVSSLLINAGVSWIIAKVIIWAAAGFGTDIADKFYYLFWPIFVILLFIPRGK